MMESKKYYAACSFGKDSIATVLLALEHGEPLDAAIYVEVMFDNSRNISGDDPEQIAWIDSYAIPRLEALGCKCIKLRSDTDYVTYFHQPIVRGDRAGLIHSFPYSGHCSLQRECKIKPQRKYLAGQDYVQYVGIAADEPKRLLAAKMDRLEQAEKVVQLSLFDFDE